MDLSKISNTFSLNIAHNVFADGQIWYENINLTFQPDYCIVRSMGLNSATNGIFMKLSSDINPSIALGIVMDSFSINSPQSVIPVVKSMNGSSSVQFSLIHATEPRLVPIAKQILICTLEFIKLI